MIKKCPNCENKEILFSAAYDDGFVKEGHPYAFNLYVCELCGTVVKEDVWYNSGCLIINKDNTIKVKTD